uniref:helicase associated domain-containing protein n=1 Tax=Ralstonia pickettii TaxID=329 RepID=UPI002D785551
AQWEEGFGAARACFEQYGHCNAAAKSTWPEGDPKGYPLGTWVGVQRQAQKAGKLPAERAQRLEALGMVWDMRAPQQATANPPEYFVLKGEAHSISRKAI